MYALVIKRGWIAETRWRFVDWIGIIIELHGGFFIDTFDDRRVHTHTYIYTYTYIYYIYICIYSIYIYIYSIYIYILYYKYTSVYIYV
jgi:hypothetical protein